MGWRSMLVMINHAPSCEKTEQSCNEENTTIEQSKQHVQIPAD
jgi:hypothetical protein